jgi:phage tail sheath protein FI
MAGQLLSSKIIVTEEEPRVRGIPSVSTAVTGAVGVTERGPIGKATLVTSFEEFESTFGGFTPDSDLVLAAMGFFENGGSYLWVVRTAHYQDVSDPGSATAARGSGHLVSRGHHDPTTNTGGHEPESTNVIHVEGKDPGSYANRIVVEVRPATSRDPEEFDLSVIEDGVYREVFANLSMNPGAEQYIERAVNDPYFGSALIRLTDQMVPDSPVPGPQTVRLAGGDDGLAELDDVDFIGSEAGKTGLRALDPVQDLSLLIVPGRATPAVHHAMVHYCEVTRTGSVFAVLDPPENQGAVDIVRYVRWTAGLLNLSEFGAIYWPRVKALNPAKSVFGRTEQIVVPPSGIIAGVYARTGGATPGGIYDPPAGIEKGRMFGVLGFESDGALEEAKRDLVYPKRINPLTTAPGLPRYIDGSRTLKGDGNFPFVAERRGVSFIERSLKRGLQFARHKNNTEGLRAQVRRTITSFLLTQMNNGAFRSREPGKAFFVDVSDQLNTPTVIFSGKLVARVGLATNKPAEFIILRFSQDTRAIEAQLAEAGA